MTTDEEHAYEFLRFVSAANLEVVQGRLDAWHMTHSADTEHPGHVKLQVYGMKGEHDFELSPACSCDLAEQFLHATALLGLRTSHADTLSTLAVARPDTKGAKVTRIRRDGKPRH